MLNPPLKLFKDQKKISKLKFIIQIYYILKNRRFLIQQCKNSNCTMFRMKNYNIMLCKLNVVVECSDRTKIFVLLHFRPKIRVSPKICFWRKCHQKFSRAETRPKISIFKNSFIYFFRDAQHCSWAGAISLQIRHSSLLLWT